MLGGDLVALGVVGMRAAVVARGALQRGGHHVPAGAATADQVQRGELARHVVGLAVGRGHRADQADLGGQRGQRREQRDRLEAVQEVRRRFLGDEQAVGDEGEGDAGGFGAARAIDVEIEVDAGIGRHARVLPGVHVGAGPLDQDAEVDLAFVLHGHASSRDGNGPRATDAEPAGADDRFSGPARARTRASAGASAAPGRDAARARAGSASRVRSVRTASRTRYRRLLPQSAGARCRARGAAS